MLSKEKALEYAKEILQISDVEEKLKTDKLNLLNELIRAQHQHIPYQNFSLLGVDVQDRTNPSQEKCVADNLSQLGGVCINLQGFFVQLLQAFGYNSFLVFGDIPKDAIRNDHSVIIVKNVQEVGDMFYVDVGFYSPTLCAIPLHDLMDGHFHSYQFSFLHLRLAKEGDYFVRIHKKKSKVKEGEFEWLKILYFQPNKQRNFEDFDDSMNFVFTNDLGIFTQFIYASRYLPNKAITIKDLVIKIWNGETKEIEQIQLDSAEKTYEKFREYFPMLPLEVIKKGINGWKNWEERNPGKTKLVSFELL